MRILEQRDHVLVCLERGEDVLATLTSFCAVRGFGHALVQGIGAIEDVVIGAYDLRTREYRKHALEGGWEVLALNGNLAWRGPEPFLHLHATLADLDGQVRGGHLFAASVHITLECAFTVGETRVHRDSDDATGLHLWQLPEPIEPGH